MSSTGPDRVRSLSLELTVGQLRSPGSHRFEAIQVVTRPLRFAERRGSWPNDTGCEASTASIWRRSLKWRGGPALARHSFPASMIG